MGIVMLAVLDEEPLLVLQPTKRTSGSRATRSEWNGVGSWL